MKKYRIHCLILALSLLIGTLAGCAGTAPTVEQIPDETAAPMQATAPTETEAPTAAPTEAPKETQKPTEASKETEASKPTEAPKPTEPKATEAPKPTEPKPTEAPKPAHTHSYSATTVAPTCESKGYTKYSCACGDSYQDSYVEALGHSYTTETVAATTESEGYDKHTCAKCGDVYKDNYTEKLVETSWVTEAAVQQIVAELNAYAASIGFYVDAEYAESWAADGTGTWHHTRDEVIADQKRSIDVTKRLNWTAYYVFYYADTAHPGHYQVQGRWGLAPVE